MVDPFEDPDGTYFVLTNAEGRHSMWPVFAEVPVGWQVVFGQTGLADSLEYVEQHWTDMRPNSLVAAMDGD